jgi:hypothetical protein
VVNHGEAPAIIEDVQSDFIFDTSETALSVIRSHDLIVNPIIGPGESRINIEAAMPETMIGEDTLLYMIDGRVIRLPDPKPGHHLMLRVRIQYRGISSLKHESAALWRWNFTFHQFEVFGGEKENYAR